MTPPPALAIIAAVARNGVIGVDGGLPWRLPADLKRFRAPDHALARRARRRARAPAGEPADRDHAPRYRARVRGQGDPHRDPRAGPPRPEDPPPEARAAEVLE